MTEQILIAIFERLGWAGICLVGVYFLARKLTAQYENRIKALENASKVCEADRITLRQTVIELQNKVIDDLIQRLNPRP